MGPPLPWVWAIGAKLMFQREPALSPFPGGHAAPKLRCPDADVHDCMAVPPIAVEMRPTGTNGAAPRVVFEFKRS